MSSPNRGPAAYMETSTIIYAMVCWTRTITSTISSTRNVRTSTEINLELRWVVRCTFPASTNSMTRRFSSLTMRAIAKTILPPLVAQCRLLTSATGTSLRCWARKLERMIYADLFWQDSYMIHSPLSKSRRTADLMRVNSYSYAILFQEITLPTLPTELIQWARS